MKPCEPGYNLITHVDFERRMWVNQRIPDVHEPWHERANWPALFMAIALCLFAGCIGYVAIHTMPFVVVGIVIATLIVTATTLPFR